MTKSATDCSVEFWLTVSVPCTQWGYPPPSPPHLHINNIHTQIFCMYTHTHTHTHTGATNQWLWYAANSSQCWREPLVSSCELRAWNSEIPLSNNYTPSTINHRVLTSCSRKYSTSILLEVKDTQDTSTCWGIREYIGWWILTPFAKYTILCYFVLGGLCTTLSLSGFQKMTTRLFLVGLQIYLMMYR